MSCLALSSDFDMPSGIYMMLGIFQGLLTSLSHLCAAAAL